MDWHDSHDVLTRSADKTRCLTPGANADAATAVLPKSEVELPALFR